MQLDTHTLTGRALDWAVAIAEKRTARVCTWRGKDPIVLIDLIDAFGELLRRTAFCPSEDHARGGEIIEKAGIAVRRSSTGKWFAMLSSDLGDGTGAQWNELSAHGGERYGPYSYQVHKRRIRFDGETMLIAAMRCYAASILGPKVDVPDELLAPATISD